MATFDLVEAALILRPMQHKGDLFLRWMIYLDGYHMPIALAVVPASIASVL
jgi:hypothetical protein